VNRCRRDDCRRGWPVTRPVRYRRGLHRRCIARRERLDELLRELCADSRGIHRYGTVRAAWRPRRGRSGSRCPSARWESSDSSAWQVSVPAARAVSSVQREGVLQVYDEMQDALCNLVGTAATISPRVTEAIAILERDDGMCKIADVANEVGLLPSQIRKSIKQVVGLTPKTFARLLMLNRAMEQLLVEDNEPHQSVGVSGILRRGTFHQQRPTRGRTEPEEIPARAPYLPCMDLPPSSERSPLMDVMSESMTPEGATKQRLL